MDKQFEEILKEVHVYGEPITKDKINSPNMIDLIIKCQNLEIQYVVKIMELELYEREKTMSKHTTYPKQVLQGELVFIKTRNGYNDGWYQKLRGKRKANGDLGYDGYFKITEPNLGKFCKRSCVEDPNRSEVEVVKKVLGGENVVKFIASGFSDEDHVFDIGKEAIIKEICELTIKLEDLKAKLRTGEVEDFSFQTHSY